MRDGRIDFAAPVAGVLDGFGDVVGVGVAGVAVGVFFLLGTGGC